MLIASKPTFRHGLSELLAAYLKNLQLRPLRTKMTAQAVISTLTELISSYIAYGRPGYGPTVTSRVPKMAFYGGFISAPLNHFFMTALQRIFKGRTGFWAKSLESLLTYLLVLPIQNAIYLASMAIIAGANTVQQVRGTLHAALLPMMKVSWAVHPVITAITTQVIPPQFRVVFLNLFGLCISTYFNTRAKMRRVAEARKQAELKASAKDEELDDETFVGHK
ncbi:hypothetical protein FSARC_10216 [Fusarium sarcochroum]|uniref:Integral membrane protein n=1 Tax=Fusarium sarcochroum TaxID=1208366 RepID=A0A8H4TNU7_9HYPO|nr:hypothetical protein FSARC_10216 [Fusarium sarcochroum]